MKEETVGQAAQGDERLLAADETSEKVLVSPLQKEHEDPTDKVVQTGGRSSADQLSQFVDSTHEYVREFITFADQKAAFLFAATTAMLVYIYRQGAIKLWWIEPSQWNVSGYGAFFATMALFGGALFAVVAVWPRLGGNKRGLVYWKAIASLDSSDAYVASLFALSDEELIRERARHLFEIATVCDRKYLWVNCSIWLSGSGLLLSVLLSVLGVL